MFSVVGLVKDVSLAVAALVHLKACCFYLVGVLPRLVHEYVTFQAFRGQRPRIIIQLISKLTMPLKLLIDFMKLFIAVAACVGFFICRNLTGFLAVVGRIASGIEGVY